MPPQTDPASPPDTETKAAQTHNIVFIGETGSGKSSVINLIANRDCAAVSPDATPCTAKFASYEVSIEGKAYRLWDAPGLNKPSGLRKLLRGSSASGDSIKRFLQERRRRGELDLLVFCVRGTGRVHESMSKAYRIFCRTTRQISTPVVIAVTHLEREQPTMETWWQRNERILAELGWASQQEIWDLISKEYHQRPKSVLSDREYLSDPKNCVVS